MKIGCHCGQTIFDITDALPEKAHLISDQDWLHVFDRLDAEVVDRLADKTLERDAAYMKTRAVIGEAARMMWQCRSCGRLYIDDRSGKLHCYLPANDETDKEILRSRAAGERAT